MAKLSSAAVGELVSEIDELKNTLEGTLIDRTELDKRYAAATAGLLTEKGAFNSNAWDTLDAKKQVEVEARLSSLKQELGALREAYSHQDGPADVKSFMHKEYASNRAIMALTAFALLGLFFDLALICHEWQTATAGTRGILDFKTPSVSTAGAKAQETGAVSLPPSSPERAALNPNSTPSLAISVLSTPSSSTPGAAGAVVSPVDATVAAMSGATGSPRVSPSPEKKEEKATTPAGPTEQAVLWMVILMGALGGFLRLASSMGNYVGNANCLEAGLSITF